MRTLIDRPSAPPNTLLRAIEEARYAMTNSSGQYQLYRKPVMTAMTEHAALLASTPAHEGFVRYCMTPGQPWKLLWEKIAPLIGQPENLGQPAATQVSARQLLRKLERARDQEEGEP